jgi:hypothetical protein
MGGYIGLAATAELVMMLAGTCFTAGQFLLDALGTGGKGLPKHGEQILAEL